MGLHQGCLGRLHSRAHASCLVLPCMAPRSGRSSKSNTVRVGFNTRVSLVVAHVVLQLAVFAILRRRLAHITFAKVRKAEWGRKGHAMKSRNSYSDGTWSRQKHYAVKIEQFLSYLMHSGRLESTLTSRLRRWEIGAENPYINSMPSRFFPCSPNPANGVTHAVRRPFVVPRPPTLRTNTTSPSTRSVRPLSSQNILPGGSLSPFAWKRRDCGPVYFVAQRRRT